MKKRTLFLSCLLALVLSTAALAADYTDVPADSWARESIDKAAEYGLMNGVGEGRFGLGETISREQSGLSLSLQSSLRFDIIAAL